MGGGDGRYRAWRRDGQTRRGTDGGRFAGRLAGDGRSLAPLSSTEGALFLYLWRPVATSRFSCWHDIHCSPLFLLRPCAASRQARRRARTLAAGRFLSVAALVSNAARCSGGGATDVVPGWFCGGCRTISRRHRILIRRRLATGPTLSLRSTVWWRGVYGGWRSSPFMVTFCGFCTCVWLVLQHPVLDVLPANRYHQAAVCCGRSFRQRCTRSRFSLLPALFATFSCSEQFIAFVRWFISSAPGSATLLAAAVACALLRTSAGAHERRVPQVRISGFVANAFAF